MTPEIRAKKDKCTLAVYADGDKLRILAGILQMAPELA
jgi:hypothetical protein